MADETTTTTTTTAATTTTTTDINIEHKLELAFIALLAARDYFKAGGAGHDIPMLQFMDNSADDRPAKYLVIHAEPAEQIAPGMPMYKIPVNLVSLSHMPSDKDRKICKVLYNECFQCLKGITKADFLTATGLAIDGIVMTSGKEGIEPIKDYQMLIASCEIFITQN